MEIQGEMAERAIELLELPEDEPRMVLDLGCGSGLSGVALDEAGHMWVGMDISESMLSECIRIKRKAFRWDPKLLFGYFLLQYSSLNQISRCFGIILKRDFCDWQMLLERGRWKEM